MPGDDPTRMQLEARPAPHAPGPGPARRRAWQWLPWGVSLALHAALVISGFFIVWSVAAPAAESRPPILVSFDEPAPIRLTADEPPELSGERGAAVVPAAPTPDAARPSLSELVAGLNRERAAPTPAASIDRAKLAGERRFPEVRFAGMGASNAERIIYVVDASGSMVSTFPFVLTRLESSVTKLASTQRFQIIFFQRDDAIAAPHPEDEQTLRPRRLIRASKENVARVLEWARGVRPAGRGNPIRALQTALALKPDAIFVLSSATTSASARGLDRDRVLADLEKLNPVNPDTGRRPTVIKTIQFVDPDPAEILKSIGESHGGAGGYRFIPSEELSSP